MPSTLSPNDTPALDPRYSARNQSGPRFIITGGLDHGLPSDWYLRICGVAAAALKGGSRLEKELPRGELLVDSWRSRIWPVQSEGGSSARPVADTQPVVHSVPHTDGPLDDLPPPPYSLEAGSGEQQADDSDLARLAATTANVALNPSPSVVRPELVSTPAGATNPTSTAISSYSTILNTDSSSAAPFNNLQVKDTFHYHSALVQSMPLQSHPVTSPRPNLSTRPSSHPPVTIPPRHPLSAPGHPGGSSHPSSPDSAPLLTLPFSMTPSSNSDTQPSSYSSFPQPTTSNFPPSSQQEAANEVTNDPGIGFPMPFAPNGHWNNGTHNLHSPQIPAQNAAPLWSSPPSSPPLPPHTSSGSAVLMPPMPLPFMAPPIHPVSPVPPGHLQSPLQTPHQPLYPSPPMSMYPGPGSNSYSFAGVTGTHTPVPYGTGATGSISHPQQWGGSWR